MFATLAFATVLICAFAIPLIAPWRERSLYIGLSVWLVAWLFLFYFLHVESHHHSTSSNSLLVGLVIAAFSAGSLARVAGRGIVMLFRRASAP